MSKGFVVLSVSRDPDYPGATVHATFDAAKAAVREMMLDPENTPPPSAELTARIERFLDQADPDFINSVEGEGSWNEWVYLAPIARSYTRIPDCDDPGNRDADIIIEDEA